VPKGYDPDAYCSACLHVCNDLQLNLLPRLDAEAEERNAAEVAGKRYKAQQRVGNVDDAAWEALSHACNTVQIQREAQIRKSCSHIIDNFGEELADSIAKEFLHGSNFGEGREREDSLRTQLCVREARACEESELDLVPHTANVRKAKQAYKSERPPSINDKATFVMVGSTLNETLQNASERDLVVFFAGRQDWDRGTRLWPRFDRLAELMHALEKRPPTFMFAMINCELNDLIPPFDQFEDQSTILVIPVKTKIRSLGDGGTTNGDSRFAQVRGLRLLNWLEPDESTLSSILVHLSDAMGHARSKQHIANLHYVLGDERTNRATWWQDDELLNAAHEGLSAEALAELEERKARVSGAKQRAEKRKEERVRRKLEL